MEKVCKLLRKDDISEEHMEDAGMLEFSQVGVELLKAFVMVHVLRGVENLIWATFNSRTMHNYTRDQRQANRKNDDVIVEPVVHLLMVHKG